MSFEDIFEDILKTREKSARSDDARRGRTLSDSGVRARAKKSVSSTYARSLTLIFVLRGGMRERRRVTRAAVFVDNDTKLGLRVDHKVGATHRAIETVMRFRSHEEIGGAQGDCLFGCFVGEKEKSFGDVSTVARLGAAQRRGHDRGVLFGDALE